MKIKRQVVISADDWEFGIKENLVGAFVRALSKSEITLTPKLKDDLIKEINLELQRMESGK